ncbi:uncharacterized protein LOC116925311 [Daphnia magna]|uniref:Uncharacterized protein n=2 Tax=Daphnia magna TaxID=35525 RepID=A0ABQ9ZQT4_9CRUS|nr:uncharacterized protein LOC116925311 [Daphnia magna]KAK4015288.1 hypothetical protein OUZ56_030270 [Daphnia magna]KZS09168.1 Uncharacterized protein APZ42_026640 [Daphnia magna]
MADFRLLARTHGFMKLAEIIIALVCLILIRTYSLNFGGDVTTGSFHDRYNVGLVTVGGMLLVSLPLLISYLWSTSGTYQPFLEIIYNTLGFILFLTVGSLALDHYRNYAGVTHTGNDNRRGDMNDWLGNSNTTQSDTGIGKAFGFNTTDNVTAGKALGALCIINAFFYLTDAALALRQGSTV